MERPEVGLCTGDHMKVMRWLTASEQYYKEKFPELSDKQWRYRAMDYCMAVSPYGKRYAVHQMNVPLAQLPQFEFPLQEEQNFEGYIAARRSEALSSAIIGAIIRLTRGCFRSPLILRLVISVTHRLFFSFDEAGRYAPFIYSTHELGSVSTRL